MGLFEAAATDSAESDGTQLIERTAEINQRQDADVAAVRHSH